MKTFSSWAEVLKFKETIEKGGKYRFGTVDSRKITDKVQKRRGDKPINPTLIYAYNLHYCSKGGRIVPTKNANKVSWNRM